MAKCKIRSKRAMWTARRDLCLNIIAVIVIVIAVVIVIVMGIVIVVVTVIVM